MLLNRIWYYYDATGTRIAMECNGIMSYYIYNLQGDVIGMYNEQGMVVVRYTYDSWGKLLSVTDGAGGPIPVTSTGNIANLNPLVYLMATQTSSHLF